ncbi:hypothetical protein ABK040_006232 [Willaertia magna]
MSEEFSNENQVVEYFQKLQQEYNAMAQNLARIELEIRDHTSVLSALSELNEDRKCYRLVGGVLVERTVKEVIPAVSTNKENLESSEERLKKDLEDKEMEIAAFKTKYKIRFKNEPIQQEEQGERKTSGGGVLA